MVSELESDGRNVGVVGEDERAGLPPWDARRELYVGGLLSFSLWQLIPELMGELARVGLTGGKDGSPVDAPPEPGMVAVDVGGGQTVMIRPGAYRDEDGYPQAEVREKHGRTDLAILGAVAAFEGGLEYDEGRLRADYQRLFEGREPDPGAAFAAVTTENEKSLLLARALLVDRDPATFAGMSEMERRERVVSVAQRIGKANVALRQLAADLEAGTTRQKVKDAQKYVLAAELKDLRGLKYREIARKLGMGEPGKRDKNKAGHQPAEAAVERGRELLDRALGGEGRWLAYAAEHRRGARTTS